MIYATGYGAKFDGRSDDTAALQNAIDSAHSLGEPLTLPGRTAIITRPLDLRGRNVEIFGTIGRTQLLGLTAGMTMLYVEETDDVIYSPFLIDGVILNGYGQAAYGMRIRYRHHSVLRNMLFVSCTEANVWEQDTWISRRENCRSVNSKVGWQIEGSNFDSSYFNCYNAGCTRTQWLLNNNGSLLNGSNSLLLANCGATDAVGSGIEVNGHVVVNLQSCYFGENCDGPTVVNNGGTITIEGGTLSYGWKQSSFLALPIGGEIVLEAGCQINGQDYGSIDRLTGLTAAQVAKGSGTLRLEDAKGYMITGGEQVLAGDPIGFGAQRQVFVPRLGRQFNAVANNTTVVSSNPKPNSLLVICTSVIGGNPIIGVYVPLALDYRFDEPFYLLLVYRSSKRLQIRVDAAPLGTPVAIMSFPPAADITTTHIKVDNIIPAAPAGAVFEILMPNAGPDDFLQIDECYLADSTMAKKGVATVNRIVKC